MTGSTTQKAAAIRAAYKARGWSARQISVRAHYFSLGSSIDVSIKDGAIPVPVAKAIANEAEDIRRTGDGEILSGGNLYVHVTLTPAAEQHKAAPYLETILSAISCLPEAPTSLLEPCGYGFYIGRDRAGHLSLWNDHGHLSSATTPCQLALCQALAIEAAVVAALEAP